MPRKELARTLVKDSTLTLNRRNKSSLNSEAFLFEVEVINDSLPSKDQNKGRANQTFVTKKSPDKSEVSTSTRKVRNPMMTLLDDINSNTSENSEHLNEKVIKKAKRKKKIRSTEDLNYLQITSVHSDDETKVKSKKTKKAKVSSFLPVVDMIDEDKNPCSSEPFENSTTDSDNKENETFVKKKMILRRGRSRKSKKKTTAKKNGKKNDVFNENIDLLSVNSTTDSDNKEKKLDITNEIKVEHERSRRTSNSHLKRNSEKLNYDSQKDKPIMQDTTLENSPNIKKSLNEMKSSFEVSFNYNKKISSEGILDNLNITTRDSRKSSYKKSCRGLKYSLGSEDEDTDTKRFVTVRKRYHTMIDFDTGSADGVLTNEVESGIRNCRNLAKLGGSEDTETKLYSDEIHSSGISESINLKESIQMSPTKGILKKSPKKRRSTFAIDSKNFNESESTEENVCLADKFSSDCSESPIISKWSIRKTSPIKDSLNKSSKGSNSTYTTDSELNETENSDGNECLTDKKFSKEALKQMSPTKSTLKNSLRSRSNTFETDSKKFNETEYYEQNVRLTNKKLSSNFSNSPVISKKALKGMSPANETLKKCQRGRSGTFEIDLETFKSTEKDDCSPHDISKGPFVLKEKYKRTSPKKGILKKSLGRKRDTFELLESYFENAEEQNNQSIPAMTTQTKRTPAKETQTRKLQDIFDIVANTPTTELDHMMIGSGESVLVTNSFVNQTINTNIAPRLTRTSTFIKDKESVESPQIEGRKSTRKRWSEVERMPIFNKTPQVEGSNTANTTMTKSVAFSSSPPVSNLTPSKSKHKMQEKEAKKPLIEKINDSPSNVTKLKSVSFYKSPMKSNASNITSEDSIQQYIPKGKKWVKIESPLTTPKLHAPLVMKKTPKPTNNMTDNSILARNCAFSNTSYQSPPSATSTPFYEKKEVSLLKKILTNEKTKADKSTKSSSSRVKMPNFRKIHERQFEKMENIKELQERKALRAQYLLSGTKIIPENANHSKDIQKEPRKKLMFSPLKVAPKKISKPVQHMLSKRASLEKKKKESKIKVPFCELRSRNEQPKDNSQKPISSSIISKLPVLSKRILTHKSALEAKGETNLLKGRNLTKETQVKAVATKSKPKVNLTERSRKQQAVVRTNRRFELLMQMRASKK